MGERSYTMKLRIKKMKPKYKIPNLPLPLRTIERRIYLIRGQEVMLDYELAELYQTSTGNLNLSVRRNHKRFPADFMFRLTKQEHNALLLQFAIAKTGRGGRQTPPLAFTEHGVAMLSSVLNSDRAIQMNIFIIRAFIQLRKMMAGQEELSKRLQKVEGVQKFHGRVLVSVVEDIKKIKNPPRTNAIGFRWRGK